MRQYRGKRIDNGEWERGHHFRVGRRHFIISLHCVLIDMYPSPFIRDFIEVDPATVGQSICEDKDDNDVFLGDLVRVISLARYGNIVEMFGGYGICFDDPGAVPLQEFNKEDIEIIHDSKPKEQANE